MLSSGEIKLIRSLKEKKFRDAEGLFVVEGEKMVAEAGKSGFKIEKIFFRDGEDGIGEAAMAKISMLSSPSPALAVVRKPEGLISDKPAELLSDKGLYLALDSIRDPGNLGTIIRICDWFGIEGIIASQDTVDVFNPKVVQSTMGAVFRVPFHYASVPELCMEAVKAGGKVYGTFLDGEDIYGKELSAGTSAPDVVIIGNESDGISQQTAAFVTERLFIPPYPSDRKGAESLNAAVASAVTLAEFRRRGRRR